MRAYPRDCCGDLERLLGDCRLNHPAKLTKLGSELDKRIKYEARKAQAGNMRSKVCVPYNMLWRTALTPQ